MHLFLVPYSILALSLAAQVSAAAQDDNVGKWTVQHVKRTRTADGSRCDWSLNITQAEVAADAQPPLCVFSVGAKNSSIPCDVTDFAALKCSKDSVFHVSAGHSDMGFVVMTLFNGDEQAMAYYGFDDGALNRGEVIDKQVKLAYPVGFEFLKAWKREVAAAEWTVRDMVRTIDPSTNMTDLKFIIEDGSTADASSVPCHIQVDAPECVNPATMSWANKNCRLDSDGSDYTISWGYDTKGDAAVMTVVSPGKTENAWFGFDKISMNEKLGSSGPNPVSPCNCGGQL